MMGLHEIVNREIVLVIVQPRAASDDLFEFDHRVDGAHQNNVADVARIHASGKFLRRGENRRNRFFIVLKIAQILFAERAIVRGYARAIVRIGAGLDLVDEVAHGERVILGRAEHERFFALINLRHKNFDAFSFALFDFDDAIEIGFNVAPANLDFAFDQFIVGRINIFVERRRNLLELERREEIIVDAFLSE